MKQSEPAPQCKNQAPGTAPVCRKTEPKTGAPRPFADQLRGLSYNDGANLLSPRTPGGPAGGFSIRTPSRGAPGSSPGPLARGTTDPATGPGFLADGDRIIAANGTEVGTFQGEYQGRTRAQIIAERISSSGSSVGSATAFNDASGAWKVRLGSVDFEVQQADADASGFACRRMAACVIASRLSGKPVPKEILDGDRAGFLSKAQNDAVMQYRNQSVAVGPGGTILAYGVRLGPFVGSVGKQTRAEVIAARLQEVPSTAYRGAKAEGDLVTVGSATFQVTPADAAAMAVKGPVEGAKEQAALLTGTWRKGANAEAGRRVLPKDLAPAALFEFARAVAEGPGHASVDTNPGQVTVVGLRGVWPSGIYDPKNLAQDDLVIPLVVDRQGRRRALRLSGTVDPGGTSGGATQVGDTSQDFQYSNVSGNKNLAGTTLLRPVSPGIEGKDVTGGVKQFDQQGGNSKKQGATLIHLGTSASQSRGCTVIIDKGS